MNCPENEFVCSVKKENNLGYYRLHTIWKNNGFFINIISRDGAWRGEMTAKDVKDISSQLEVSPETYLQQCKESLTFHDGQPGLVYAVENGMFTWKKVVDEDSGIKIKMGSVMLEPTSFIDTVQNLVDIALKCNKKLQTEVEVLTREKEEHAAIRNEYINKFNELIKAKNEMENSLYKKFLLLLNTKKKKILELENALEAKAKKTTEIVTEQNSEDDYEAETEEEKEENEEVIKKDLEENFSDELSPRKRKFRVKESTCREEAVEQKKFKIIEERMTCMSIEEPDLFEKDLSKSGSSGVDSKTDGQEIPSTKDELLDYFFGGT